jgi:hypothetical protein
MRKRVYVSAAAVFITACLMMLSAREAHAANITSAQSGNWGTNSTWAGGVVPGAADNVTIASGHTVTMNSDFTCTDLTINSGGTLNMFFSLTTTGNVTVNGTLGGSGAPFQFNGAATFTNNGSVTAADLRFTPTSALAQTIAGNGTWSGAGTLTVGANNSTLTMSNAMTFAYNQFQINNFGTFNTGGNTLTINDNTFTVSGTLSLGTGTLNVNGSTFNNNNTISGTGLVRLQPAGGTLSFFLGSNNFTPALEVASGVTTISTFGTGISGPLTIDSGAEMKMAAGDGLRGNGNVTLNAGGLLSGSDANSFFVLNGTTLVNNGSITVANFRFREIGGGIFSQTLNGAGSFSNNTADVRGGDTLTLTSDHQLSAVLIDGNFGGATFDITNRTLKLGGAGTPLTVNGAIITTGSTIEYDGAAAQTAQTNLNGANYNNLTINNTAGVTLPSALTIPAGATLTLANGVFTNGGNLTMANNTTIARSLGSMSNTPAYAGVINLNYFGSSPITTGPELTNSAAVANNLTIGDTAGVILSADATVTGLLALTSADLNTSAFTLNMPASGNSSGGFDVAGNVRRTGLPPGNALTFGNPNNLITINFGATPPTDITVNLVKSAPVDFTTAIQRTYTVTPNNGSAYNARLRLHYRDTELNGNSESILQLYEKVGATWTDKGRGGIFDDGPNEQNWIERNNVTQFSPWTIANGQPTAANATITGQIINAAGAPLGGVLLTLTGGQSVRRAITDEQGFYQFAEVETDGFYTVTPFRANYAFGPRERAFSLISSKAEALFSGTALPQTANPLDTPEFFVRQQYLDFLAREPEQGGLDYWSNQIRKCGVNQDCINARRRDVAAAFFIEQEFRQTGSFIYRLYKGSLGRQPSFAEFKTDRAQVSGGENLEASRTAFAERWLARDEFKAMYPAEMSPELYVNHLFETAGLTGLQPERQELINAMLAGGKTRAQVLRDVIEMKAFKDSEDNPSFVLMQYFGYLKREPEKGGYAFWLNVLNNKEPGNYRGMVCSFITSAEYQSRFSSVATHSNQECK